MSAYVPPWQKGSDKAVSEALADDRKPWDPPTPKVPAHIIEGRKKKAQAQGIYRPETRLKAQGFAKEYIKDFDHRAAAIRMGVDDEEGDAQRIGRSMLNDPETLQAIQAYLARIEDDIVISRSRVLSGLLKEACYHGLGASASARVAAWGKLAKLIGMEEPQKDPDAERRSSGVMLVPFMEGGIDAWETAAIGQQAQLKADVRG